MTTQTAMHTLGHLGEILHLSGLGTWQFDFSAQHLLASPVCIALLGAVPADDQPLSIETLQALVHPQDWPAVLALLNASTDPQLSVVRFRVSGLHGAWRWLEAKGGVQARDAQGQARLCAGVVSDVSELVQANVHQSLQIAFSDVLVSSPDRDTLALAILDTVLGLHDLDGGGLYFQEADGSFVLHAARGLSDTFLAEASLLPAGSPRAQLIEAGQAVTTCLGSGDPHDDGHLLRTPGMQAEGIVALVVLPIRVNGRSRACLNLASKHVRRLSPGTIHVLQSLAIQFGLAMERLSAREDAVLQRQNLEGFFNTLQDYVFVLDTAGHIVYVNPAVSVELGHGPELLGQHVLAVHPPRVHAMAKEVLGAMLRKERVSCSLPLLKADGSEIMVDTRVVSGTWNGQPALLGISRDITELNALQARLLERNQFQRAVLDNFPFLVWLKDPEGRFLEANIPFALGCGQPDTDHVRGKTDFDIWPADLAAVYQADDQFVLHTGRSRHVEELVEVNHERRWIETYKSPVLVQGSVIGTVGYARDITSERQANDRLCLAASVFANSYDGILITDADNRITEVNPAFCRITGYDAAEAIGQSPRMLGSGRQSGAFYADMWQTLQTEGHWSGEVWNRRKNGEVYAEILSVTAVKGDDGKLSHYLGVFSDITRLKAHEAELAHIAQYDMLTGVPNRRLLGDRMKVALARARREKVSLAVCMLDLDGFKEVNDRHGHDVGDRLLIEVARRLQSVLREDDSLARLGGDEFVFLLSNLKQPEECHSVLERMLRGIAQPMVIGDIEVQVSASIGLTLYPQDDADPDTLLRHADQAMYGAKQAGKNCYHLFDPEHDRQVKAHLEQLLRFEQAMQHNELVLFYQPKVNLKTGHIVGAEALLRWQHPELGLRLPAQFLQLLSGQSLDIDLGEWVIETALAQMSAWLRQGVEIDVSVNISADHLLAEGFVAKLADALARHTDVMPQRLELEILETAAIGDLNSASLVLAGCRALGVRFALDDFGTGYSSLAYFRNLSVDLIKIDQSFVRDMLDDPNDLGIVDSVVRMAQAFNRPVIAEGVETLEHGSALLLLGCSLVQGYGVARPMPAEHLPDWMDRWKTTAPWRGLPDVCVTADKLTLRAATRNHQRWMATVAQTLEAVMHSHGIAPDLPPCRFGHWLRSSGGAHYGAQATFLHVGQQHEAVHRLVEELMALAHAGRNDDMRHRLPDLAVASEAMVGLLDRLMAAGEGCSACAPPGPVNGSGAGQ